MTSSSARAVVCFAGPRDHYEGAAALAESGQLERLVTDAYFGAQAWHNHAAGPVRDYIHARRHPLIEASAVSVSARALFWESAGRLPCVSQQACRNRKDAAIGRHAAWVAESTGAHLLAYSYYAGAAFNAGRNLRSRLLFQVHPPVLPLRRLYQEEIEREPAARASLSAEMETLPLDAHAEAEQAAPSQAQGILCASNFTRRTLLEAGTGVGLTAAQRVVFRPVIGQGEGHRIRPARHIHGEEGSATGMHHHIRDQLIGQQHKARGGFHRQFLRLGIGFQRVEKRGHLGCLGREAQMKRIGHGAQPSSSNMASTSASATPSAV
jgi:hypothetical protein